MLVIAVSDLMFQSRIAAAAEAKGVDFRVADRGGEFEVALAGGGAAIIDLHDRMFDAMQAIAAAKSASVRVLAFGRHTEPALLRAARDAGAAIVVPRSQLVEELPKLLEQLIGIETN
jgi:hypothetical protein